MDVNQMLMNSAKIMMNSSKQMSNRHMVSMGSLNSRSVKNVELDLKRNSGQYYLISEMLYKRGGGKNRGHYSG